MGGGGPIIFNSMIIGGTTGRKGRYGRYVMHCGLCARGSESGKKVICYWLQTIRHIGSAAYEDGYVNRRSRRAKEINNFETRKISNS